MEKPVCKPRAQRESPCTPVLSGRSMATVFSPEFRSKPDAVERGVGKLTYSAKGDLLLPHTMPKATKMSEHFHESDGLYAKAEPVEKPALFRPEDTKELRSVYDCSAPRPDYEWTQLRRHDMQLGGTNRKVPQFVNGFHDTTDRHELRIATRDNSEYHFNGGPVARATPGPGVRQCETSLKRQPVFAPVRKEEPRIESVHDRTIGLEEPRRAGEAVRPVSFRITSRPNSAQTFTMLRRETRNTVEALQPCKRGEEVKPGVTLKVEDEAMPLGFSPPHAATTERMPSDVRTHSDDRTSHSRVIQAQGKAPSRGEAFALTLSERDAPSVRNAQGHTRGAVSNGALLARPDDGSDMQPRADVHADQAMKMGEVHGTSDESTVAGKFVQVSERRAPNVPEQSLRPPVRRVRPRASNRVEQGSYTKMSPTLKKERPPVLQRFVRSLNSQTKANQGQNCKRRTDLKLGIKNRIGPLRAASQPAVALKSAAAAAAEILNLSTLLKTVSRSVVVTRAKNALLDVLEPISVIKRGIMKDPLIAPSKKTETADPPVAGGASSVPASTYRGSDHSTSKRSYDFRAPTSVRQSNARPLSEANVP